MTTENARDCEHGQLRRKCDECFLLRVAESYVGWDATPEEAMEAMHGKIKRLERELAQLKAQHEFDTMAKDELRRCIAKLLTPRRMDPPVIELMDEPTPPGA